MEKTWSMFKFVWEYWFPTLLILVMMIIIYNGFITYTQVKHAKQAVAICIDSGRSKEICERILDERHGERLKQTQAEEMRRKQNQKNFLDCVDNNPSNPAVCKEKLYK
jgi:hypothetical protein